MMSIIDDRHMPFIRATGAPNRCTCIVMGSVMRGLMTLLESCQKYANRTTDTRPPARTRSGEIMTPATPCSLGTR